MISSSIDAREIRKFGIIAFLFFGVLCGLGIWREKLVLSYFFGCVSLIGLSFWLFPKPLSPVYDRWLKISHFIGRVITVIILTLAFYLVITPAALLKRIVGGRPLPMKPDPNLSSYWVTRSEPVQPRERFIKRY